MLYTPRPYQQACLRKTREVRRQGKNRALVVMASGLGKTVVAAFDVKQQLEQSGGRVLYLCHQNDILKQARKTFEAVLGDDYSYGDFHGGADKDLHEVTCLFASFQAMANWRDAFFRDEFDYIVVDESHHGQAPTYRPTLEYFEPKFLLAITATPDRADLKDIRQLYGEEVFDLPIEKAWAEGLLTPADYWMITDEIQDLGVLKTPIGRLTIRELNRILFIPKRDEEVVRIIEKRTERVKDRRMIIFCPSIDYAEHLATLMPQAVAVHSRIAPWRRKARMEAFREGSIRTVLTVDMFNEGIDIPEANVIVFLRSTASRTIFLQQLGRGLRLFEGKKRMLVLDFVGNCERLELVQDLWKRVQELIPHSQDGLTPEYPFTVDVDQVKFTEVALNVLDVIAAVRGGYTKEVLVQQLHGVAARHDGKIGSALVDQDSKLGLCASSPTFRRVFGSFPAALVAAGLTPRRQFYTMEMLKDQMRWLVDKYGAALCQTVINEESRAGNCATSATFSKRFGSLVAAYEAVGASAQRLYATPEELLQYLADVIKETGKVPTPGEINERAQAGTYPRADTYTKLFGGLGAALQQLGHEPTWSVQSGKKLTWTEEELKESLRNVHARLNKVPTRADLTRLAREGGIPVADVTTYAKYLGGGSWVEALVSVGIEVPRRRSKSGFTREEVISQLQALAHNLGRTPETTDIRAANRRHEIASMNTIGRVFGSLEQAQLAAGLDPGRGRVTPELAKKLLQTEAEALGRSPQFTDMREKHEREGTPTPHALVIALVGGRYTQWNDALEAAGLPLLKGRKLKRANVSSDG